MTDERNTGAEQQDESQQQAQRGPLAPDMDKERELIVEKQLDAIERLANSGELHVPMKSRKVKPGRPFIFLAIAAVLGLAMYFGSFYWYFNYGVYQGIGGNKPVDTARTATLASGSPYDIASITITCGDSELSYTMDENSNCALIGNEDYPVDSVKLKRLFFAFADVTAKDTVADDSSLKSAFGFLPYTATATVAYDDGTSAVYYLGSRSSGNDFYLMREGDDAIYLVDSKYWLYMTYDLADVTKLVDFATEYSYETFNSFIVEGPDGDMEIWRDSFEDTISIIGCRMLRPYQTEVSPETVTNVLMGLDGIAITDFVTFFEEGDDLSAYGLDEASRIHFRSEDVSGNVIEMYIGSYDGASDSYYVINFEQPTSVYTVSSMYVGGLVGLEPFSFVSTFAAIVNIEHVSAIAVHYNGEKDVYTIQREMTTDATGVEKPVATYFKNGTQISEEGFLDLYQVIIGVTIDGRVAQEADGTIAGIAAEPTLQVVYSFDNGIEDFTIDFYPYKTLYYAFQTSRQENIYFYCVAEKVNSVVNEVGSFGG